MLKDFIRTSDLSARDLRFLLDLALSLKADPYRFRTFLQNDGIVLYFNKPSTRTRISFEMAVTRLGAQPISVGTQDLQLGRGETLEDTAKMVSRYARAFVIRTHKDSDLDAVAKAATVPVINALTNGHHPCQSLADLMTLREQFGQLQGLRLAYVGDGNNVAKSLMEAAALSGMDFAIASPPSYCLSGEALALGQKLAAQNGGRVTSVEDPIEAVKGADCVYTDVWLSMGDPEQEKAARMNALRPYQVNQDLMNHAKDRAVFMHCLPAHRGEEVTSEVIDSPYSIVLDEAENRLHTSVALLYALIGAKLLGAH